MTRALAVACVAVTVAMVLPWVLLAIRPDTTTPTPCQHAATSAWSHLHALTDESGTRVPIEAIHADMAGLRACGVTR